MEPAIQLLSDLVAIPSVNPMGRNRTGSEFSEANLAEFLVGYLRKNAIDVDLQTDIPGRPNVIGYVDAGSETTIMLEAHLDTVHTDTMTIEPFAPEIRGAYLYGRGSCDTKGSMASFLTATTELTRRGAPLKHNVLLVFVVDEEYRFTGARLAMEKGLEADFGIAGEPTLLHIVRAHKGVTRWKIRTSGVSAHSAYPERGENAIFTMGVVLHRLEQLAARLRQRTPHPLLGTPTLSPGVIEGGQAVNMVPDRCWVELDRRSLPGETTESILDEVRHELAGIERCAFDIPYLSVGGMEVPEDAVVVQTLADAVRKVTGSVSVEAAFYATDAGIYNSSGIPTVVFGPGDIGHAHTDEECVEINQVEQAVVILQHLLKQ